jgi:hypothetical protein
MMPSGENEDTIRTRTARMDLDTIRESTTRSEDSVSKIRPRCTV